MLCHRRNGPVLLKKEMNSGATVMKSLDTLLYVESKGRESGLAPAWDCGRGGGVGVFQSC
jgi:hypothetical protein